MSLGLFNCRLIQPAGDQLFFFSAVLPRRCQFGQALFSLLVTRPARPRPTGGAECFLSFLLRKILSWFSEGRSPVGCRRVDSHRFTREIPRRSPNPTHRFCYRATSSCGQPNKAGVRRSSLPGLWNFARWLRTKWANCGTNVETGFSACAEPVSIRGLRQCSTS